MLYPHYDSNMMIKKMNKNNDVINLGLNESQKKGLKSYLI
jgi:hypothetical protein